MLTFKLEDVRNFAECLPDSKNRIIRPALCVLAALLLWLLIDLLIAGTVSNFNLHPEWYSQKHHLISGLITFAIGFVTGFIYLNVVENFYQRHFSGLCVIIILYENRDVTFRLFRTWETAHATGRDQRDPSLIINLKTFQAAFAGNGRLDCWGHGTMINHLKKGLPSSSWNVFKELTFSLSDGNVTHVLTLEGLWNMAYQQGFVNWNHQESQLVERLVKKGGELKACQDEWIEASVRKESYFAALRDILETLQQAREKFSGKGARVNQQLGIDASEVLLKILFALRTVLTAQSTIQDNELEAEIAALEAQIEGKRHQTRNRHTGSQRRTPKTPATPTT